MVYMDSVLNEISRTRKGINFFKDPLRTFLFYRGDADSGWWY